MMVANLVQGRSLLHRPCRARRLNTRYRPVCGQITRQHAELPGKTRSRMETEQRWPVALTQRKQGFITQTLRLFVIFSIQQHAQFAYRRGHHDLPRRHLTPGLLAQLRGKPHRQQRMTTQREEISFHIINLATEQRAEGLCHQGFRAWQRFTALCAHRQLRQRQGFTIELTVSAQRQRIQLEQHDRHHMWRQLFPQLRQ